MWASGVSVRFVSGAHTGFSGPPRHGVPPPVSSRAHSRPAHRTRPDAGADPVDDHDEVTRILGAQLQRSELQPKLTVREALELYASFHPGAGDWRPVAERLGLTAKLGTRLAKLSGGQKQRLFIVLVLVGRPPLQVGTQQ
ncbi:hypothetical protein GCM10010512_23370 [Streptomyces thermoviolaceus subsp. thermoviolaceus]|nr:hypothetical protein GCM10010499_49660 [Streptomyces thermoviolaceus subsp. apingens]GHA91194.1 hypothetical protein GCM10010512_23370 [Streptomyces thermoviolaceus subsp. thermoviolaceus]